MLLKFFGIMMMAITMQNASASEDSKKQKTVTEALSSSDAQAKANSGSAAAPQSAQPSSAVNQLKQQAVAAVSSRLPWKASMLIAPHAICLESWAKKK